MKVLIIGWGIAVLLLVFIMLHGFGECETPYIDIDKYKEENYQ